MVYTDAGSQFTGKEFRRHLQTAVENPPTAAKTSRVSMPFCAPVQNPEATGGDERGHRVVNSRLKVYAYRRAERGGNWCADVSKIQKNINNVKGEDGSDARRRMLMLEDWTSPQSGSCKLDVSSLEDYD